MPILETGSNLKQSDCTRFVRMACASLDLPQLSLCDFVGKYLSNNIVGTRDQAESTLDFLYIALSTRTRAH